MDDNNSTGTEPNRNSGSDTDHSLSTASLIIGICSIVLTFVLGFAGPIVGMICGIVGLVLAARVRKTSPNGLNQAGLILSIIGIAVGAVAIFAAILVVMLGIAYFS